MRLDMGEKPPLEVPNGGLRSFSMFLVWPEIFPADFSWSGHHNPGDRNVPCGPAGRKHHPCTCRYSPKAIILPQERER